MLHSPQMGFILYHGGGSAAIIQNTDSGVVTAKLQTVDNEFYCCCFSPSDRLVAGSAGNTIYIWDITKSDHTLLRPSLDIFITPISLWIDQVLANWYPT